MNRWTAQLLPPELLGSHIASARSHTTGRVHDLSFRAATAIFGHLGIEWDLTNSDCAGPGGTAGMGQLLQGQSEVVAGRRPGARRLPRPDHPHVRGGRPRSLLGDLYSRVDRPIRGHTARSAAIPWAGSGPTLPLRADHGRKSAIRPEFTTMVGGAKTEFDPSGERRTIGWDLPDDGGTGFILSGAALASTGVMAAQMHPEHAVLYRAEALD